MDLLISLGNRRKSRGQRARICSFCLKIVENKEGNGHVVKISKNPLFGGFAWGVCAASHQSDQGWVQNSTLYVIKNSTVFLRINVQKQDIKSINFKTGRFIPK